MVKRIVSLISALTLMTTILVGISPAPVQASWNACDTAHFCRWSNTNYWGVFVQTSQWWAEGSCVNSAQPNGTSSLRNNTPRLVYIFEFDACTGNSLTIQPYQSIYSIPSPFHDRVRSFYMQD